MKEIKVTKTMYETIDGQCFETEVEAEQHEASLNYHKDIISCAMRIREMCDKYVQEGDYGDCSSSCPFKKEYDCCILDDSPCDWKLPLANGSPS